MHIREIQEPLLDTLRMKQVLVGVADVGGKIARMLDSGELIQLRRGLYASRRDLDPQALAGPIYGPSYVSFETALSWHGMIPEGVTEILSATPRRPADFSNSLGQFRYLTVPKKIYSEGIAHVNDAVLPFLIASPTKALVDRIAREAGFRSMSDVRHWMDGMRIQLESPLDHAELSACAERYGRPSVRWLFALR